MALFLKQSTAVDVLIGPFVDDTNGATAETGESPSVKLSKNGQTLGAKNDVTTPAHDADGYYNCEFDATDTNTVGTLVATVAASGTALPVRHEFHVVEEAIYDALYGASAGGFDANGRVDVGSVLGTAQTAGDLAALVTTVDTVVDAVLVDTGTTLPATLSAIDGKVDTVDTNVDAVLVDTGTTLPATLSSIDGKIDTVDTNVDSVLADTGTDGVVIAAAQTVATVTDVTNQVSADVTGISGSATAADNLEASALGIVTGAVNGGTPTTTTFIADGFTEATNDHFNGRIVVFTSGVLANQASDITDYTGSTQTITCTAFTEAPADNDTFVIL